MLNTCSVVSTGLSFTQLYVLSAMRTFTVSFEEFALTSLVKIHNTLKVLQITC